MDELQRHLSSWGRQTIAFAMSVRAQEIAKPIDGEDRVRQAAVEAGNVAQDLWTETLKKLGPTSALEKFTSEFARAVLAWSTEHLK
jgi:hypothetical protein